VPLWWVCSRDHFLYRQFKHRPSPTHLALQQTSKRLPLVRSCTILFVSCDVQVVQTGRLVRWLFWTKHRMSSCPCAGYTSIGIMLKFVLHNNCIQFRSVFPHGQAWRYSRGSWCEWMISLASIPDQKLFLPSSANESAKPFLIYPNFFVWDFFSYFSAVKYYKLLCWIPFRGKECV